MVLIFTKEVEEVMRILLVDDRAYIIDGIKDFLEVAFGKAVDTLDATSGAEAIKILQERSDIDLVVTDQEMPGMNGDELIARIKERFKIPVILWSFNDLPTATEANLCTFKGDTDSLAKFIKNMQKSKKSKAA